MTVYRSSSAGGADPEELVDPVGTTGQPPGPPGGDGAERGWFEPLVPPDAPAADTGFTGTASVTGTASPAARATGSAAVPAVPVAAAPPVPAGPAGNGAGAEPTDASQPQSGSAGSAGGTGGGDGIEDEMVAAAEHLGAPRAARRARKTRLEEELEPVLAGGREPGAAWRTGLRNAGEVLITLGLILLLFAGYEIWGKSAQVNAAQSKLDDKLEQDWQQPAQRPPDEPPLPGEAIARLHIPRLAKAWVVVEGTKQDDIKNAPGHYPKTAMPGQLGNFAVAGHRMPAIWWDLDKVQPGDPIIVETRDMWWVYTATQNYIIDPHKISVVAPNPENPRAAPTKAMLTLTTCNPKWDNYERLIVHAELPLDAEGKPVGRKKSDGRPPELPG